MIKVVDYGSGNVTAICNIYSRLGISCGLASHTRDFVGGTKIILPGVGAFDVSMRLLADSGMLDVLNNLVCQQHVPVLGVCVGMQMMADGSEEGVGKGLGWIAGDVRKIDTDSISQKPILPHMGWNSIEPNFFHSIFDSVDFEKGFYFLHSFRFHCENSENVLATTNYGGRFASAIVKDNIFGFQFHPEKSHENGIKLLENFAKL